MLFPNELWKLILGFNSIIYQQRKHCETILSYYENQSILGGSYGYIERRDVLAKLMEKALRYNQCVCYLNEADGSFKEALAESKKHGKVFKLMDDMESLLACVWMRKFH
jgi:hypothetical protein